jgi:hypothetical protein
MTAPRKPPPLAGEGRGEGSVLRKGAAGQGDALVLGSKEGKEAAGRG